MFFRSVRVEGLADPVATVPLGFLTEEVVKISFPRSYRYFNEPAKGS